MVQAKKKEIKEQSKRKSKRNRGENNNAAKKKQRNDTRMACIDTASLEPMKIEDALGHNKYKSE